MLGGPLIRNVIELLQGPTSASAKLRNILGHCNKKGKVKKTGSTSMSKQIRWNRKTRDHLSLRHTCKHKEMMRRSLRSHLAKVLEKSLSHDPREVTRPRSSRSHSAKALEMSLSQGPQEVTRSRPSRINMAKVLEKSLGHGPWEVTRPSSLRSY
uniref:Uncharacterized protein n=1 Tax=Cannabis sativa TaxID=3483 RepID=A0A803Q7Y8_CANSA